MTISNIIFELIQSDILTDEHLPFIVTLVPMHFDINTNLDGSISVASIVKFPPS
jgi:hypothetical protein